MQRQSNNFRPQFSDEEGVTVYLWGISQRRFEQKTIYEYTKNHLLEWFSKLPTYQAFSDRLNRLAPVFQALAEHWLYIIGVDSRKVSEYIVDSCPVILAKGSRSGHAKAARELCEKCFNFSRKEWYYGLKLHAVVARRPGRLPAPLSLMASGAAFHNLPAAKRILQDHLFLKHGRLYADKAYMDAAWAELLEKEHSLLLFTPRKNRSGDILISGDTFSTSVCSLRQPAECFSTGSIVSPTFNPPPWSAHCRAYFFMFSLVLSPLSLLCYSTLDLHFKRQGSVRRLARASLPAGGAGVRRGESRPSASPWRRIRSY